VESSRAFDVSCFLNGFPGDYKVRGYLPFRWLGATFLRNVDVPDRRLGRLLLFHLFSSRLFARLVLKSLDAVFKRSILFFLSVFWDRLDGTFFFPTDLSRDERRDVRVTSLRRIHPKGRSQISPEGSSVEVPFC